MRGGFGMRAAARVASVALILAGACLRVALLQSAGAAEPRRPFFERLRRLEAQFQQLQGATLRRLQETEESCNLSRSLHTQLDQLRQGQESLQQRVANGSWASPQEELRGLQAWLKKLERKGRRQALRVRALEEAGQQPSHLSSLAQELQGLREGLREVAARQQSLQQGLESQGSQLGSIKRRLKTLKQKETQPGPGATAHRLGQSSTSEKLQAKNSRTGPHLGERGSLLGQAAAPLQLEPSPASAPEQQTPAEEPPGLATGPAEEEPGTRCHVVEAMLVFPNASTENFAAFQPGLQTSLWELSLCSWVRTSASYLGTILSYATEENDNKLVLHGRDAAPRNAIHFVIGDPAFRELPVGAVLDGRWHHVCLIWSSLRGRYWFYLDRRLASMGSNFRKGYKIPAQGSLVLGQEQDTLGGGFESSESFVGLLAGFAVWGRALLPGEVSSIALGEGHLGGALLTLANVSTLGGSVRKVDCTCLEHCLL
ncbi:pentraxin-4 [Erythrolamprus reginae]|uniref:pentraxin-4 n=1 Tax=Erythrolamprus reginae TaxID=121349 RepID=UPI00396C7D54